MKSKKNIKIKIISNSTTVLLKDKIYNLIIKKDFNPIISEVFFEDAQLLKKDKTSYDLVIIQYDLQSVQSNFINNFFSLDKKNIDKFILRAKKDLIKLKKIIDINQDTIINNFYNFYLDKDINYFEKRIIELNYFLHKKFHKNCKIVNLKSLITNLGLKESIDKSKFISSKILYTDKLIDNYIHSISGYILNKTIYKKKVLVVDGDNTLWPGILGDEGYSQISKKNNTTIGKIYLNVQQKLKNLKNSGTLLVICSKNNFINVKKLFEHNKKVWPLKFEDFVVKKINWKNKPQNIINAAKELNLNIESFAFLDDSDFEINLVKNKLKSVETFQVPKKIELYFECINNLKQLFFKEKISKEDKIKTELYFKEFSRNKIKERSDNLDNYLKKLQTKIKVFHQNKIDTQRASEMTLKFNQFNFLTRRYNENQIISFLKKNIIISFKVEDKYGEYGNVGIVMLKKYKFKKKIFELENFLLSCRVFDRFIEHKIIEYLLNYLKRKCDSLIMKFELTEKNERFINFFEELGFTNLNIKNNNKKYVIEPKKFNMNSFKQLNYIKIR